MEFSLLGVLVDKSHGWLKTTFQKEHRAINPFGIIMYDSLKSIYWPTCVLGAVVRLETGLMELLWCCNEALAISEVMARMISILQLLPGWSEYPGYS